MTNIFFKRASLFRSLKSLRNTLAYFSDDKKYPIDNTLSLAVKSQQNATAYISDNPRAYFSDDGKKSFIMTC